MKKIVKTVAIVLFAGFILIQFIRPDQTNPPIVQAETLETSTAIPQNVEAILQRSCNDCHTNATVYPWYSNVSPFNWLLANHINDGRNQLNFSLWNTYEDSRKRRKLDQVCEQATSSEMPLPSYLWIHRDAKLSPEDVKILCDWSDAEREKLAQKQ
ncbi:MAG: heme-binding domain-containing protein [Acidobacteriota bacterium]|nr:heme-binding domain-containing protein [Acidobacteriota bacterium]